MVPAMKKNTAVLRPLLLCVLVIAAMTGACAQAPARSELPAGSAGLLAAIKSEVGEARCDGPQQCRSVAIGAKPCGGPDGYLAWSTGQTDEARLTPLLARYAAARTEENRRANMSSTCVMETNPGVSCQASRCTLRPRGLGTQPGSPSGVPDNGV
jgi:hypothetical protein